MALYLECYLNLSTQICLASSIPEVCVWAKIHALIIFFKLWSLYMLRAKKRIIITTITEITILLFILSWHNARSLKVFSFLLGWRYIRSSCWIKLNSKWSNISWKWSKGWIWIVLVGSFSYSVHTKQSNNKMKNT